MIAEILISCLFVFIFGWQLMRLSHVLRIILCLAFLVHIGIIGYAHYWAVQQDATGIVFDLSTDAQKYYYVAEALSADPLYSINPLDISAISGGVWHFGYYYLNIICIKLSADPMLLMRMIKVFVFFFAVAVTARYWEQQYGTNATMWGILYLTFGWWEVIYYNFRNFRDGLIVSVFLVTYVLYTRIFLFVSLKKKLGLSMQRVIAQYGLLLFYLTLLLSLRVYVAVVFVAGIIATIIIESNISVWRRIFILFFLCLVGGLPFINYTSSAFNYAHMLLTHSIIGNSVVDLSVRCLQVLLSPIPWQYTQQFLIPSQFFYLIMICLSLLSVVFIIKSKPWGQVVIVILMVLFLGVMVDSSYARKRMPLVPIFVSWMVAGISRSRIRYKLPDEMIVAETQLSLEEARKIQ